jgi:hypothetical protein
MTHRRKFADMGRDEDGTMYIICGDGSAASFRDGRWPPGIPWSGRTICEYRAVESQAQIEKYLIEASSALQESLKQ